MTVGPGSEIVLDVTVGKRSHVIGAATPGRPYREETA
jgi:hypothetical protein